MMLAVSILILAVGAVGVTYSVDAHGFLRVISGLAGGAFTIAGLFGVVLFY